MAGSKAPRVWWWTVSLTILQYRETKVTVRVQAASIDQAKTNAAAELGIDAYFCEKWALVRGEEAKPL